MTEQKNNPAAGTSGSEINCPHCGEFVPAGNFCAQCAHKMVEVCDCWKLNRKFNCGHDQCPTMSALLKEFGDSLFPS
ncbi:hypothetical protein SDC9_81503 [bioreactor metagenome]|uniref:Uncharacterized protein n=1 Tax=bioreactor metagenome TaxID=1076179 RepID=A0A644Z874_9ZZZZ